MKLSTRVRYGVRAMIELAKQKENQPVPLRELAKRQLISPKYLEQMAVSLKIAGLVVSVRGADGGYRLARPASDITVMDIYNVLAINGDPIDCHNPPCPRVEYCSAREVWADMIQSMKKNLQAKTLQQLANREIKLEKESGSAEHNL